MNWNLAREEVNGHSKGHDRNATFVVQALVVTNSFMFVHLMLVSTSLKMLQTRKGIRLRSWSEHRPTALHDQIKAILHQVSQVFVNELVM